MFEDRLLRHQPIFLIYQFKPIFSKGSRKKFSFSDTATKRGGIKETKLEGEWGKTLVAWPLK